MNNERPYSEWQAIVDQGKSDFDHEQAARRPWAPTPESVAQDEANRVKARRELSETRFAANVLREAVFGGHLNKCCDCERVYNCVMVDCQTNDHWCDICAYADHEEGAL